VEQGRLPDPPHELQVLRPDEESRGGVEGGPDRGGLTACGFGVPPAAMYMATSHMTTVQPSRRFSRNSLPTDIIRGLPRRTRCQPTRVGAK
jgi:hypothetical protein